MTANIGKFLVEDAHPDAIGEKVSVFISRMMLRLFNVTAFMAALAGTAVIPNDDGTVTVQLDFHRLPQEVMPTLMTTLSIPGKVVFKKYIKDGQARTGIEFKLSEKDLPGDPYDMAGS